MNKFKYPTFKNSEEDDEEVLSEKHLGYSERSVVSTQVKVYLDESIKSPKYYRGVVDKVTSLGEGDQVVYIVSSPGGQMDGMISLIEANRQTDADILCIISGICHSAASMFSLTCPNISVSPSATMLVHFVSFGTGGIASHVKANVDHTLDFCTNYFKEIYEGFLTEEEMDLCINSGKEIWLQSDEIISRLEARQKYFRKLDEIEDQEESTGITLNKILLDTDLPNTSDIESENIQETPKRKSRSKIK